MVSSRTNRSTVFISYSHKDKKYLEGLLPHLKYFERNNLINYWVDNKLKPGSNWRQEIEKALSSAKVAILLISVDFLISDFIVDNELPSLLAAAQEREVVILPVVLRPCSIPESLAQFQMVNPPSIPLAKMKGYEREELWVRVAHAVIDALTPEVAEAISHNNQLFPSETAFNNVSGSETNLNIQSNGFLKAATNEATFLRYLIFLLDSSGSMSSYFPKLGRTKVDATTNLLNFFLNQLISTNIHFKPNGSIEIRNAVDITILRYEGHQVDSAFKGSLAGRDIVTLSDLQMNPIDVEIRKQRDIDNTGNILEIDVPVPIWFRPMSGGSTPMRAALYHAKELAAQWISNHPHEQPPIVVNITDGMPTDGDITQISLELQQLGTSKGKVLFYNVHLTDMATDAIIFPDSKDKLPNDFFFRQLFSISSVLSKNHVSLLEHHLLQKPVTRHPKGLIVNGDAYSLHLMLSLIADG